MIFLFLSIFASVGILIVFKVSGRNEVPALELVLVNYIIAFTCAILIQKPELQVLNDLKPGFYIFGSLVGICFMLMFLFINYAINQTGISIVSSATKLSVVFPILLSVLIDPHDIFSLLKGFGMLILLVALFMLMVNNSTDSRKKKKYMIPFLLFMGMGVIDSIIKYAQQYYVPQGAESIFSLYVFLLAFIFALFLVFKQQRIINMLRKDVIIFGILLGVFNFGSLFFLLKTLNLNLQQIVFLDSSRILMFNNIGIVLTSVFVGLLFFKEKLSVYNYFGILLSVIGFYFLI